ncbi:MAG: hypothetical protein SGCHY_002140 [Lobulomycetales sp.]
MEKAKRNTFAKFGTLAKSKGGSSLGKPAQASGLFTSADPPSWKYDMLKNESVWTDSAPKAVPVDNSSNQVRTVPKWSKYEQPPIIEEVLPTLMIKVISSGSSYDNDLPKTPDAQDTDPLDVALSHNASERSSVTSDISLTASERSGSLPPIPAARVSPSPSPPPRVRKPSSVMGAPPILPIPVRKTPIITDLKRLVPPSPMYSPVSPSEQSPAPSMEYSPNSSDGSVIAEVPEPSIEPGVAPSQQPSDNDNSRPSADETSDGTNKDIDNSRPSANETSVGSNKDLTDAPIKSRMSIYVPPGRKRKPEEYYRIGQSNPGTPNFPSGYSVVDKISAHAAVLPPRTRSLEPTEPVRKMESVKIPTTIEEEVPPTGEDTKAGAVPIVQDTETEAQPMMEDTKKEAQSMVEDTKEGEPPIAGKSEAKDDSEPIANVESQDTSISKWKAKLASAVAKVTETSGPSSEKTISAKGHFIAAKKTEKKAPLIVKNSKTKDDVKPASNAESRETAISKWRSKFSSAVAKVTEVAAPSSEKTSSAEDCSIAAEKTEKKEPLIVKNAESNDAATPMTKSESMETAISKWRSKFTTGIAKVGEIAGSSPEKKDSAVDPPIAVSTKETAPLIVEDTKEVEPPIVENAEAGDDSKPMSQAESLDTTINSWKAKFADAVAKVAEAAGPSLERTSSAFESTVNTLFQGAQQDPALPADDELLSKRCASLPGQEELKRQRQAELNISIREFDLDKILGPLSPSPISGSERVNEDVFVFSFDAVTQIYG